MMGHVKTPNGWGPRRILASALAGVGATVVVAVLTCWLSGQPLSEFPSWLEAWATVFGVGAAVVAGFYAARAFGLETIREERWEGQQESAQAALVAAWPGELVFGIESAEDDGVWGPAANPALVSGARAFLKNASPLPVMEVEVDYWLVLLDGSRTGRDRRLLGSTRLLVLPPSSQDHSVRLKLDELHRRTPSEIEHSELRVEVSFRDTAGRVWSRDAIGNLVPAGGGLLASNALAGQPRT